MEWVLARGGDEVRGRVKGVEVREKRIRFWRHKKVDHYKSTLVNKISFRAETLEPFWS